MAYRKCFPLILLLLLAFGVLGCRSKTFADLEYLSERLQAGDEQAFRYVRRLEDPEARVAAIPALVEAFEAGVQQDEILRILHDIGHPDGLPAFLDGLQSDDTALAGLAARGIAAVGAAEHVGEIAARLSRVRDPSQYEPFLDALRSLPGRPEVAPVLTDILRLPAGRIGGINTVRYGCEILGNSGNTDPATIDVVLFSYVNFIPQPFQDARLECQLALVQMGEAAVGPLFQMFLGQNQTVNDHLTSMRYTKEVGSLRAAGVLADGQFEGAKDRVIEWFNTEQEIDRASLSAMPIEDQQIWFQNYGQMFEFATQYVGRVSSPTPDDPGHQLLRGLLVRGEGSPLENFRQFMNTSDGAELGLRAAALRALANVADPADRDVVFEIAMAGNLQRGRDVWLRQEAAHTFALMSRAGDLERFQQLINGIDDAALREALESYRPMVEIAESCQGDVSCLAGHLTDDNIWAIEKAAYDLAHVSENQTAAAGALLAALDHPSLDARLMFVQGLRRLPLPQTGLEQIDAAIEASSGPRFRDFRHALRILRELKAH